MNIWMLLALAGVVSIGAKYAALTIAARTGSDNTMQRLGHNLVAATSAAIGAPAVAAVCSLPSVMPGAALASTALSVLLAARGRPLPVVLAAALATYLAITAIHPL